MRKRINIKIMATIVVLSVLLWMVVQKREGAEISGIIVDKTEMTFTFKTKSGLVVASFPDEYDGSKLKDGDEVIVYFAGEILETSPARIKDVKKIVKQ